MMPQTRQLAAIMFTDIAGYTALMQRDESIALEKLHRFKDDLHRSVHAHEGRIIQYFGDGCLVIFQNSADAVHCAADLQETWQYGKVVPTRIGIHLGEFVVEEGNIFGDAVNVASRIESMGVPGAILLSESVRNQVRNKPEFTFTSLGRFAFKNVEDDMEIFALANPGLHIPDPSSLVGKFRESGQPHRSGTRKTIQIKKNPVGILIALAITLMAGGYLLFSHFRESANTHDSRTELKLPRSIAVLPFTDMSADKSQEYLGDGLADDIISALSGIEGLKVIGRTSSFQFKGKNKDLREIGEILAVESVLEGSVQKSNGQLRITAQLINVRDGSHLWSQKWDRDMTDIFRVQDEIANGIREKLQVTLHGTRRNAVARNSVAYEDFLKGRRLLLTNIPQQVIQARDYFLKARQQDTTFAEATAFLSMAYRTLGTQIYPAINRDARRLALDSSSWLARVAVSLDQNSAASHLALAGSLIDQYDWINAEKAYRKAHQLSPGTLEKNFLATFLGDMGVFDEAIRLAKDALVIDPLDLNSMLTLAYVLRSRGAFTEAIRELEKIIRIDSTNMKAYASLGHCYVGINQREKALQAWAKQHEINGNKELAAYYLSHNFTESMQEWIRHSTTIHAPFSSGDYTIAVIYAYAKDKENTLAYLERAIQTKSPLIAGLKHSMIFDFLKDDERYKSMYKRAGFEAYDQYKSLHN